MADENGTIATASIDIDAPREQVWAALTDPASIKRWMMGSDVETTWAVGSPITWQGEFDGKAYQDKGEVVAVDEPGRLEVTHYSPLMGDEDVPESYHTLVWTLTSEAAGDDAGTRVEMTQDGCDDTEQAEQFSANWQRTLDALKETVES